MAGIPNFQATGSSNPPTEDPSSSSTSTPPPPARGKEMRMNLLNKLRAPPLVHSWDFWHDRQDRATPSSTSTPPDKTSTNYENRLVHLASISDVRTFWSVFNNFDISALPLRDSIHLFHHNVKPLWEDARNMHGGSWTFRVPKAHAPAFWERICLLAVGEKLQAAVEDPAKRLFRDDICGVSLSVRFTSCLVQVWNRDAGHVDGVRRVLETVLEGLERELMPREGGFYYKAHHEHAAFGGKENGWGVEARKV